MSVRNNGIIWRIEQAQYAYRRAGTLAVLQGFSASVSRAEVLGIWGRNASGKSTILKLIAGALIPDSYSRFTRSSTLEVSYLPQDPMICLLPWFRAWRNVQLHSRIGMSKADAESVLGDFGFDQAARTDAFPGQLSGGSAQRLGWACTAGVIERALMARSGDFTPCDQLLVLDEPFAEQDQSWCKRLAVKIRKLRDAGVTTVLVSHEAELLTFCCDRIVIVQQIPVGETEEVTVSRDGSVAEGSCEQQWSSTIERAADTINKLREAMWNDAIG